LIELQKLGERLVELPGSYLKKSGIPQELLEAVTSMKNMRTHEARRRHMQHIGVLMREVDPAQIRMVLNEYSQPRQAPAAAVKTDTDEPSLALMSGTAEHMEDLMKRCPHADRTRLRQLVRNARAEADQGGKTRALTALKSYLAELLK
jgi:ribosome-associated protein